MFWSCVGIFHYLPWASATTSTCALEFFSFPPFKTNFPFFQSLLHYNPFFTLWRFFARPVVVDFTSYKYITSFLEQVFILRRPLSSVCLSGDDDPIYNISKKVSWCACITNILMTIFLSHTRGLYEDTLMLGVVLNTKKKLSDFSLCVNCKVSFWLPKCF